MVIREMSKNECRRVLAGARLARLACAHENQPYVVPVYLAYDDVSRCLYGYTTPGLKVEWMRTNPLVCVEVDEVTSHDQWVSVIAFGRYEELPGKTGGEVDSLQAPVRPRQAREAQPTLSADGRQRRSDVLVLEDEECRDNREQAWEVLKNSPSWWEPGTAAWAARGHNNSAEANSSVYYRVRIDDITGHEATRDARNAISYTMSLPPSGRWVWLHRILTRVFGNKSKGTSS
jgi:hypothetical protein